MISWQITKAIETGKTSGSTFTAATSSVFHKATEMSSSSAVEFTTTNTSGGLTESYRQTIKGTTNSDEETGNRFSSTVLATMGITTSTTQEYATNERRTATSNLFYRIYTTTANESDFDFTTQAGISQSTWTDVFPVTLTRETTTATETAIDDGGAGLRDTVWQAETSGDKPEVIWWVDRGVATDTNVRAARTAAQSATRITMQSPLVTETVSYAHPAPAFTSVTNPSSTYAIEYHTSQRESVTRTVTTISRSDPEDPESTDPISYTVLLPPDTTTSRFTYATFGIRETTLTAYPSETMRYNHRSARATRSHSKAVTVEDVSFGEIVTTTSRVISTHAVSVNRDNLNANFILNSAGTSRSFSHKVSTTTRSAVQYFVTYASQYPRANVWGPRGIYRNSSVADGNYWTATTQYEMATENLRDNLPNSFFAQAPLVPAASVESWSYIASVQRGVVQSIFPNTYLLTNGTAQVFRDTMSVTLTDEASSTSTVVEIGNGGESWISKIYDNAENRYGKWISIDHPPPTNLGTGGALPTPNIGFVNLDSLHTGVETIVSGAYLAYGKDGSTVLETTGHISTYSGAESYGTSYLERVPYVAIDSLFSEPQNRERRVLAVQQSPIDTHITAFEP
jgi:hypothetical protein